MEFHFLIQWNYHCICIRNKDLQTTKLKVVERGGKNPVSGLKKKWNEVKSLSRVWLF